MDVVACLLVLVLLPATIIAGYYLFYTTLGLFSHRRSADENSPKHFIAVLIPAHDEEASLARTIRSLRQASYNPALLRIVVIADNCTDQTADLAASLEAEVVVRFDPERRGKGFAIERGLTEILCDYPDAVLILDADCEVTPGLLLGFDRLLSEGADAAQAKLVSIDPDNGTAAYLAAVGAEIDHAVAVGHHRIGGTVPLRGTGMLFRRELLERLPWTATGLAEDAEYAAVLREQRVRVRLLPGENVRCSAPPTTEDLYSQRRRWRAALRFGHGGVWFQWLMSKPLAIAQLAVACGAVLICEPFMSDTADWAFAAWLTAVCGVFIWVYVRAISRIGLTRNRFTSLCRSPILVIRLAWIAFESHWKKDRDWHRTTRPL